MDLTGPILLCITAYLLGSLPTGTLLVRRFAGRELRLEGSGGSGGTNVARVLGWRWGLPATALDLLKGLAAARWLPLLTGLWQGPDLGSTMPAAGELLPVLCGAAAILGQVFPVFDRFRGGKGVAASAGVALELAPQALLGALGVFALVLPLSRYMFMASLAGALSYAALALLWLGQRGPAGCFAALLPLALLWLHRANMRRYFRGEELRPYRQDSHAGSRRQDRGK